MKILIAISAFLFWSAVLLALIGYFVSDEWLEKQIIKEVFVYLFLSPFLFLYLIGIIIYGCLLYIKRRVGRKLWWR